MITVGTLKKILEEFPDDSPILSVFSEEDVRYISKIDNGNFLAYCITTKEGVCRILEDSSEKEEIVSGFLGRFE